MATSAIGPGFITQTTVFTAAQKSAFGFVILTSILIDIVVQLNIWRVTAATGLRGQEMGQQVFPGLGLLLSAMIVGGGLIFSIGNIAGAGLGLQALAGLDVKTGSVISCIMAIIIFSFREFGKSMDWVAKILGMVMIAMMLVVLFSVPAPGREMIEQTFLPQTVDTFSILTLVGGPVGGYISFAGAHRMLDAAKGRKLDPAEVNRSAITGILVSGIMRFLLFAVVLGVVSTGFMPDAANPPASIFQFALGNAGQKIFGLILWAASITSLVGASFTSVSFLENWHPVFRQKRNFIIIAFILFSTIVFVVFGRPVKILVAAGAINALVLPLALLIVLITLARYHRKSITINPRGLTAAGWLVLIAVLYMSYVAVAGWLGF